jgi:hypothetical protein
MAVATGSDLPPASRLTSAGLARVARRRGVGAGRGVGPLSRFVRRWCVSGMSRRRSRRRRRLSFGHVLRVDRGLGRTGAMAALCHRRCSACRARSKQAEDRRLATAPGASLLGSAERAQKPSHYGNRPARAPAGGRLSAAGKHASNPLHELLSAALLGLPAAPARRAPAGSSRSPCEASRRLSLTGGAATKTALSQRRGFPPPLCRPCHGVPP